MSIFIEDIDAEAPFKCTRILVTDAKDQVRAELCFLVDPRTNTSYGDFAYFEQKNNKQVCRFEFSGIESMQEVLKLETSQTPLDRSSMI